MTYMELMNRFWKIDIEAAFSCTESKLYFALLDIANSFHWEKDELSLPVNLLLVKVNCSKKSLFTARKKLEAYGLIHVTKGERNARAACYKIMDVSTSETSKYTTAKKKDPSKDTVQPLNPETLEELKTEPNPAHFPTPYRRKEKEEEKENTIIDKKINKDSSSSSMKSVDYDEETCREIIKSYNAICHDLIKASRITLSRKSAILKLGRHLKTLDDWKAYFFKAAGIPFLCGGSSGWTANFDWLLKEENYLKIVEGTFYGGFESKKREYGFNDNELMFRIHAAEKQGESVPF